MKKVLVSVLLATAGVSAASFFAMPAAAADEIEATTGWQTENGKRYYYGADGKKAVGEVTIDNVTYLFAPNGALQLGWQTINEKRYYFNEEGKAVFGWVDWRGETYYVSAKKGKLTGKAETDEGEEFQFDDYGICAKWNQDADGKWHYSKAAGEIKIDDLPYLFTEDGVLLTGWQTAADSITRYYDPKTHEILAGWVVDQDGKQYYSDPEKGRQLGWITDHTGARYYVDKEKGMLSGWQIIGGKQYKLLADGKLFTGYYPVNGVTYLFGEDGVMVTGWHTDTDGKRYFKDNGVMVTGLQKIGGDTYYFNADGLMQTGEQDVTKADGTVSHMKFGADGKLINEVVSNPTGWQTVNGVKQYIKPDGTKATAPTVIDGKTYLFNADGSLATGLYTAANGSKYFGDANGVAQTGWQTAADGKRYFQDNGIMVTGLQKIGNDTYYFNASGLMQTGEQDVTKADGTVTRMKFGTDGKLINEVVSKPTGWQTVNGVKQYIKPDGTKATAPTVIDGKTYLFNADGSIATGLYTAANGSKYYGDANGVALTGWQELPNQSSYFNVNGTMAVSTKVDGYTIDANGAARSQAAITADTYIQKSDKTLNGIYKVFCSNHSYSNTETARTIDQLMAAGWNSLITPTLKRHGVCYDLAAALDFTFKRAGFKSRVIYAWHNSHHYWVQVLIDGFWWNYDPTYGMNRCHITIAEASAKDRAAGGPGYTERGYVDAVYDKKGAMISAKYTPVQ